MVRILCCLSKWQPSLYNLIFHLKWVLTVALLDRKHSIEPLHNIGRHIWLMSRVGPVNTIVSDGTYCYFNRSTTPRMIEGLRVSMQQQTAATLHCAPPTGMCRGTGMGTWLIPRMDITTTATLLRKGLTHQGTLTYRKDVKRRETETTNPLERNTQVSIMTHNINITLIKTCIALHFIAH